MNNSMDMTNYFRTTVLALMMGATGSIFAQQINDNNTPLHLMKPAYKHGYGVSTAESVKQTMDRVLQYIDAETPAQLVNAKTGETVTVISTGSGLKDTANALKAAGKPYICAPTLDALEKSGIL